MSIAKRGRLFHLRRRVPRRYRSIEPRETVWISLHTDSETVARSKADRAWSQMIEAWEARLAGNSEDAEVRYEAARDLARARGFRYLDARAVAKLPLDNVVERVEAIPAKSEDQLRRWEAPRKKAVQNFVAVVGNKEIANITRDDMLDFRQHWLDRIEAGEVTANSANKDLIHLGDVLKTVNAMKRLGLALPLGELSFKEGEKQTRPPFSEDWIRSRLLAPGALDGLNGQASALLLGMINTGYRPSEGAALTAETIRLECDVPHISIEPEGRQLKSRYARRVIPLTGVSLEAFKQFPEGFPRYRNRATLSAVVNKFLRANGLLESPRHSMYSLRHAFEDRMLAAGIDDRIRRDLFGHRLDRERYGKGASLEHVAELVARIAF